MGRKDHGVINLRRTIRRLKEASEKWKEGWEDERVRSLLQQEEQKALNELYELLDKEE